MFWLACRPSGFPHVVSQEIANPHASQCGARKQHEFREFEAGRLYTGSYHQATRRAAEAIAGPDAKVMILSAQYGLLSLDEPVLPYEKRLGQPGAVTVEYVREQARQMGLLPTAEVVVLAGRAYADVAAAIWPHAQQPLRGTTGIGEQLARLADLAAGRTTLAEPACESASKSASEKLASCCRPLPRGRSGCRAAATAVRGAG